MDTQIQSSLNTKPPVVATSIEAPSLDWYAVRVRPRSEKAVAGALREKGYEEFLPLYRKRSRWSDRVKEIDLPLFSGYVFCRAGLCERPPLIHTPNVIGILGFSGKPALIPSHEMEAVKRMAQSGAHVEPWPFLNAGQRVRVEEGALAGLEGVIVRAKSDWRVVVSVEALCRSVAVEIQREWVAPIMSLTSRA